MKEKVLYQSNLEYDPVEIENMLMQTDYIKEVVLNIFKTRRKALNTKNIATEIVKQFQLEWSMVYDLKFRKRILNAIQYYIQEGLVVKVLEESHYSRYELKEYVQNGNGKESK